MHISCCRNSFRLVIREPPVTKKTKHELYTFIYIKYKHTHTLSNRHDNFGFK
ncbi:hypothetical protein HanPSC8_Chr09g0371681 [Helianthus annuus]|nr:hypothetical protein HanPSC8_Chr09g0371681 [Helianthus annuus]